MEISEEKLRQIVREALHELGPQADAALVQKVVREVVRRLQRRDGCAAAQAATTKPIRIQTREAPPSSAKQDY